MVKVKTKFVCRECGTESVKWLGRCPGCGEWNTFDEERMSLPDKRRPQFAEANIGVVRTSIVDIEGHTEERSSCGLRELDFVLGGGIVPGSLLLFGGDPGIGKSTLLLQIAYHISQQGKRVLYVSGEESAAQIKMRAERLGALAQSLYVLAETDLDIILQQVEEMRPEFMIVDSIQTVYLPSLSSAAGSVSQVRECTGLLMRVAKQNRIATCIVGHVTKDGMLAGPRVLEHMVDTVLYFEGDRHHDQRVVRAVKNRFGSTNELAVFEMRENGLQEVVNPSELFLAERPTKTPGSAVVVALEGSRPLMLEIQALVATSSFGTPRRLATGADGLRMNMLLAVLERRLDMHLQTSDAYVNIAGGVRCDEPALDLGMAMALVSSHRNRPLPTGDVFLGEIGLTGEVRRVSKLEQRIKEAERLGFERCIVPRQNGQNVSRRHGSIEVVGVQSVVDALNLAFLG